MAIITEPLLRGRTRSKIGYSQVLVLSALAVTAIVAVSFVMSPSRKSELLDVKSVEAEIAAEKQRLSMVLSENQQLKQEALKISKAEQIKKAQEQAKKEQMLTNEAQELKEMLRNAEREHKTLLQRVADKPSSNNQQAKSSHLKQMRVGRASQQLVGEYVKVCNSWGCKIHYQPESDVDMKWYAGHDKKSSWPGKGHHELVTGNHLMYPLGPTTRENLTRIQLPLHDIIPKQSKLGDNWITFGHGDNFVKVENSGIAAATPLAPWKRPPYYNFNNYNLSTKPFNLHGFSNPSPDGFPAGARKPHRCPANPDGSQPVECFTGGDGVEGVFEASPLSPSYVDANGELMAQHGVKVTGWPWLEEARHAWDADGEEDDLPESPKEFDYDKADRPSWAFDNHALRSLPDYQNPEGDANKQLMLGSGWKDPHAGLPDLDDDWVRNETYFFQFQPRHTATKDDDHFAKWEHSSPKNLRLLYGNEEIFNGMHTDKRSGKVQPDPWSLGDVPLPAEQYAETVGLEGARTGDPLHDFGAGWSGQNMVAAAAVHVAAAPPAAASKALGPSEGRLRLEKRGVNVGGQW